MLLRCISLSIISFILAVSMLLGYYPEQKVKAGTETYNHIIPITITDTSGVARTNVPVVVTLDVSGNLTDYGMINAYATDTYIDSSGSGNSPVGSGTAYNFMMVSDRVNCVIPSLPAYGSVTVNLYTGYSPVQTSFPIILGAGASGNITIANDPSVRVGDNATLEFIGAVDTTIGADKNIYNRSGSLKLYVSPTVSGNITATTFVDGDSLTTGDDDQAGFCGINWRGAVFTPVTSCTATGFRIKAYRSGVLTNATVSIRATSGGKPTGGDLTSVTFDISGITDAGGEWWEEEFDTPLSLSGGTVYALVARVDGAVNLNWRLDTVGSGGNRVNSADGGSSWTTTTTNDFLYMIIVEGVSITATNVDSGEHTITVSAVNNGSSANLSLSIDGALHDSEVISENITDNYNDILLFQNNVMPYADNVTFTVNGTQALYYAPNAMISGTNLPDRSANSNNGTINWGSNSNITITGKDIMDSESATSVGATSAMMQGELFDIGTLSSVYLSFEYGLDTDYGYYTSETSATSPQTHSVTLTGLTPNTTYHYRAIARSGVVYAYGEDISFTTSLSSASEGSTIPLIQKVGVFNSYQQAGDWLFCAEVVLTYPPYYPAGTASEYFQLQLLSADGITILGASPIRQWGDRPASIYFNSSANITNNSSYILRVINISSESITGTVNQSLSSSDWKGDNLVNLDDWCIGCATNMQATDGTSLTDPYLDSDPTYGIIITSTAGGYFVRGIPNINVVRPNLFTTGEYKETVNTLSSTVVYNSGTTLSDRVGTTIETDAQTVGDVFGLTGQEILMYGIFAVVLLCIIYTVSQTRGFGALGALCLSLPIMGASIYMNITDVQIILFVAIVFVFLFVRQFVWKTL